ncbi:Intracellular serine protease [Paramyrothecium foliicola]|nr:Intracellular serine protease [Paramyrothecium foliicola]
MTVNQIKTEIANSELWFLELSRTDSLLQDFRKNNDNRIEIACLDTGVADVCDPTWCGSTRSSIIKAKSFVGNNAIWSFWGGTGISDEDCVNGAEVVDTDGHGTHVLSLLQRVSELADLCVAKCIEKPGQNLSAEKLAFAISFAVTRRKVDIINISIGYERDEPEVVRQAIDKAVNNGVLAFAAAGNTANGETVFPARMERVIPIYSCNPDGPSAFNPRPASVDYFCAPGEGVVGSAAGSASNMSRRDVRTAIDVGLNTSKSGTSQATAIASGVAARVLEFARAYKKDTLAQERSQGSRPDWPPLDSDENMRLLKTPHGMKRVLKLLSVTKTGAMR